MRKHVILGLTLGLAATTGCQTLQRSLGLGGAGSRTTSVFGHWVLATPIDSTAFAGASQVELTLAPGSFTLAATYPGREPLSVSGRADVANGATLTLVPTPGAGDATSVGFAPGQPFTRLATASGSTLVLAAPTSAVPVPSSVWYRLEAARLAGLAH